MRTLLLFILLIKPLAPLAAVSKNTIQSKIEEFRKHIATSSLIVGVISEDPSQSTGYTEHVFSYGSTTPQNGTPPNLTTLYRIGSLSTLFTGTLLAQMVQTGAIDLEMPAQHYLPASIQLPTYKGQPIKVIDLVVHTSGLPRSISSTDQEGQTLAKMAHFLKRYRLTRAPGEKYQYSNLGYELLGVIEDAQSQTNWNALLQAKLCSPLNLNNTRLQPLSKEQNNTVAYALNVPYPQYTHSDETVLGPAGGLFSNLHDMLIWLKFNMGLSNTPLNDLLPLILKPLNITNKRRASFYCMGWNLIYLDSSKTVQIYSKDSGFGKYFAFIGFIKGTKNGIAILGISEKSFFPLGIEILKQF